MPVYTMLACKKDITKYPKVKNNICNVILLLDTLSTVLHNENVIVKKLNEFPNAIIVVTTKI